MSVLFRRLTGLFVCGLLLGISGCASMQSQSVYRGAPPPVQQRPRVAPQQPIPQSGWTAAPQSQSSADLYQPWNLNEFPVRSDESQSQQSPYRFVSDSQPVAPKTPPPPGALQRLLPQSNTNPATRATAERIPATQTTTTSASRAFPILGIGQALRDEFRPSNHRKWSQNHAVLQTAEFNGNMVMVRNVRYSRYESAEKYTTQYYDATFNLDDIRTIDLVMVPFQGLSRVAHVESSFGFADGRQIGLSIEARYEEGEKYDPAAAGMRQFELIYVLADERDMIRLATDVHKNDVHVYRLNFEPNEVRIMFVEALRRANKLATQPEFYHPLSNSCVTNLIDHINKGRPNAVPSGYRTLMPGLLDLHMYDLQLVNTSAKTYKEAKEMAKVNWLVERYGDLEYFSAGIRQNMY
ncbi:MAG: DUF4105 domain-containing protein [Planctomycetaceae bacterium]|nr:DUF4105 domain-containing protein [Planctomycetaceae bacterium]